MADLVVRHVSQQFGGTKALEDVSFTVSTGDVLAIIGPNGAGKSTLLHIIAGQLRPTKGECEFAGRVLTAAPAHRNAQAGVVRAFQEPRLFPNLTVEENVRSACGDPKEVARLLERYGCAEVARTKARLLPYGRQKLVAFIRAMALSPKLLLLDEPSAGMEKRLLGKLAAGIAELRARAAVVVVEHDIDFVREVANQVLVLQGSVVAQGEIQVILENQEIIEGYLGQVYA